MAVANAPHPSLLRQARGCPLVASAMDALEHLGFGPFFAEQLTEPERPLLGRVTAEHRGAWEVQSATGVTTARLSGRLRQEEGDLTYPGVGDWVVLRSEARPDEAAVIDRVLTRRTLRGARRESRSSRPTSTSCSWCAGSTATPAAARGKCRARRA